MTAQGHAIDCILAAVSAELERAGYKLGLAGLPFAVAIEDVRTTMERGYVNGAADAASDCSGEAMMPVEDAIDAATGQGRR